MSVRRSRLTIPDLATANLRHEWVLTLCLVIALAAVIAPLLVLLGLKHGTIETLRERLVEDPVFRELRPLQTREFAPDWFDALAALPGVGFVTPTILPLSSVVQAVRAGQGGVELFDLVPTAAGDPLLLENGAVIPVDGECVLTAEAARRLGAESGGEVTLRVTRARGGRSEVAETVCRVASVLDPRAGGLARIYAPLSLVLDVEAYKEGYGAAQRGWAGDSPEPFLSFDGVVLVLRAPLAAIERTGLIINTGFARIHELDAAGASARLGFVLPAGVHAYELAAPGTTVTPASLRAVEQKLRGHTRVLLPWVGDAVQLQHGVDDLRLIGLSLSAQDAATLGLEPPPWGGFLASAGDARRLTQVVLPADHGNAALEVQATGVSPLAFALEAVGVTALPHPVVPVELLGVLRTATQRAVTYDPDEGRFLMARGGYRGFRLYARSIDDVPELVVWLRQRGVEVLAEVEAIERIRVLDAGLSRLFWLIAALGIAGGTAVLVASLYAAVERRRRDLGVLRLLGLSRGEVFFFPVVQGGLIAALGLFAGFAGYGALALAINRSFADELALGQRFCALPGDIVPLIAGVTLTLAVVASLAAAWRTTRIDPAEAIREQ